MADDDTPAGDGGGGDDPHGDRAWMDGKRGETVVELKPRTRKRGGRVPEDEDAAPDVGEDARAAAAEAVELAQLRGSIMSLDRVDVERLVAGEAKSARGGDGLEWKPCKLGLPPFCPVEPLGKKQGVFYFLTPDKELMSLAMGNFGQAHIDAVFAPQTNYLVAMWGGLSPKSNKRRVQYELARRDLMNACATVGVFDPGDKVRGRGAWKAPDGGLILHYGDAVSINGEMQAPGAYGGFVYPAGPPLAKPIGEGKADARAAAKKLLDAFKCWKWARGDIDARFLLGWVIVSLMGAAVDWRPQIMLTGDAGMGKSTLQHLLKAVQGERLVDVADASAAGLYQTLQHDALGVAFDEFENEDEAKGAAVMRLARLASSGGKITRGGADGVPTNYQARGAFLFSAINPPAMRPSEQSRTTLLSLRPLTADSKPPRISDEEAAAIGAHLARRIEVMWPHWNERLLLFRETLAAMKHANRAQDQFGTLLAAADLALDDQPMCGEELMELEAQIAPARLTETAGVTPNWRRCLNHVLGVQPDNWRSLMWRQVGAALYAFHTQGARGPDDEEPPKLPWLRRALGDVGLALVAGDDGVLWLAFPARHVALARAFEGTDWSARRGADGGWCNALTQAPEGGWRRERFRIGGARESGVLVKLDLVLDTEDGANVDELFDDGAA